MARGYLMWFYYNGFLHYAGMFKPKLLCEGTAYKENFLRTMTYTPFIQSHLTLTQQCFPSVKKSSLLFESDKPFFSSLSSEFIIKSASALSITSERFLYQHCIFNI
jgi:hypothetical protein